MPYVPAFQQNPSRLPTYADFGSGLKENTLGDAPTDPAMPEADEYNEMGGSIEGLCETAWKATVKLTHTGGVYSKVKAKSLNKTLVLGTSLVTGDFTVTKNGTGDLTIQFAVGKVPTLEFGGAVSFGETTAGTRTGQVELIDGRTVRVRMYNTGSASDALCTIRCD
jgi:hypothetical protein